MAFTPRVFAKPQLMTWNTNKISDHNRSELGISVERIEEATRMANGTMRKYIIADKRSFSVSWEGLPQSKDFTVDGFWGKNEIENWYNSTPGAFTLKLFFGDGTDKTYTVMMTAYSASLSKRGAYDFWSVEVELTEV